MISFEHFRMEEGVPIYPQIIGYIERGVVAGAIRSGDEMPSRRTLSALLGSTPIRCRRLTACWRRKG